MAFLLHLLLSITFVTALNIQPERILRYFFTPEFASQSPNMARAWRHLTTLESQLIARRTHGINTLTADSLYKVIGEYRMTNETRLLSQIRKLVFDYATETRSIISYFPRAPYRVDSMPLVALYHLSRAVSEMSHLSPDEKTSLLTEIQQTSLVVPVERERLEAVSKRVREAYEIEHDITRFLAGKASKKEIGVAMVRVERLLRLASKWTPELDDLLSKPLLSPTDYTLLSRLLKEPTCTSQ